MKWQNTLLFLGSVAAWTIERGAVAVSGSGDQTDRIPFAKLDGPVELFSGRSLDIGFKVPETPLPQQIAVRLSVADDENQYKQHILVDKIVLPKMRGNMAKAVIPFQGIPDGLLNRPLKAQALLAGKHDEPVELDLFDLVVYGDDNTVVTPVRDARGSSELESKPIITYTFRDAPRHVNPVVAFVFIAAIDVLFTGLFLSWKNSVKPDFSLLVQNRANLSALVLVGLLESSFVAYYLSWSIFRVLAIWGVLLPLLIAARAG